MAPSPCQAMAVALLLSAACSVSGYVQNKFPESGRLRLEDLEKIREAAACPCSSESLCNPITARREKEVFGFTAGREDQWSHLDFTQVTTVAWQTEADFMCLAHKHGVRVIAGAPNLNLTLIGTNQTAREAYVSGVVEMVKALHIDGITFDYESPIEPGAPESAYYVQVVNETTQALHAAVPGSQVSVCVAWSPHNIDGRYYDNKGFADASDLLYVMMYDTRSQVFEQCIAAPNAALPLVERGVQEYIALGVDPQKIILGLPWYGYDYPCLEGTAEDAEFCRIGFEPFRGVNCSDAVGRELSFSSFMARLTSNNTTTGRRWAADVTTPWYNYRADDGTVHQIWFDDAESLSAKYAVAKKYGLRGTGPFTYSDLDYSTDATKQQAASMWDALKVFTQ
eukprot:TRINITY_DN6566_c0_g1_i1.p1 TRINITY_DN6566_c0_g1~~TRINITY_DN6566_c0_g1_i1.p1  ORF type:complete len:430 (+),score=150.24 TRINITY_DN6566_c0_g1_i1:103-1290(+)